MAEAQQWSLAVVLLIAAFATERNLGSGSFVFLAYLPTEEGGGSLPYEGRIGGPVNIRESVENTSFQVYALKVCMIVEA